MKAPFPTLACLLAALLLPACQKRGDPAGTGGQGAGHEHAHDQDRGHEHAVAIPLGEVSVAGFKLKITQVAKLELGKEGDFDLDFLGTELPTAVRGWIGLESGVGSRKARFAKETATRMHGHPEVPQPLPEGSRLWLEVEGSAGTGKTSVAFEP